jgi:N-acetylmuramoyl-L-alanine amidase
VSAHYVIGEDGTLWRLVDERFRAWHAGAACWRGERDVNARSIGIELVNPGHEFGYRPFPETQMEALIDLARAILARHPIPPGRVLGHSDVAPVRKTDPGELFDWARLARAGIGLWPDDADPGEARPPEFAHVQRELARFGYEVAESGEPDEATRLAIAAFQRHFRPARIDGRPDAETASRLEALHGLSAGP